LLAQVMVGVCIVSSKALLVSLSPVVILTIRFIIAFLVLLTVHLIVSKEKFRGLKMLTRKDWIFIIAEAICAGTLFNILLLIGLKYTSASVAGMITSALPAIVAIASLIFLKERLTLTTLLCITLAVIGLVVINFHGLQADNSMHAFAGIIILIAILPEAAYYVLSKMHKNKLPVFLISALMNGINIPLFLLVALFGHYTFPSAISTTQLSLLAVAGLGSAFFYVFWFLGYDKVHGTAAGLSTAFMPIATLTIAWIFLSETISWLQFIGMVLVILSIVINARRLKN